MKLLRSISVSDIIQYLIAILIIVALAFYFAFLIRSQYSTDLDKTTYLLFLNSLYADRLKYCIYFYKNNSNFLFYLNRNVNFSEIPPEVFFKCFNKINTEIKILVNNETTQDKIKLEYFIFNIETVPIFLFYDIINNKRIWFVETAKNLMPGISSDNFESSINIKIYSDKRNMNDLMQKIKNSLENILQCSASDVGYFVSPTFSLQTLAIDTNRKLYIQVTSMFMKASNADCVRIIYDLNRKSIAKEKCNILSPNIPIDGPDSR